MFWASAIIQLLVLSPTVFPVLAQLDNCQKVKKPSGISHSFIRWPLWIASWLLLGIYYSTQQNDLIILPIIHHLTALLGLACWCQELFYSKQGLSVRGVWILGASVTTITILCELIIFGTFNYLIDYPSDYEFVQKAIAVSGVVLYEGFLYLLPYDRDQDPKGPGGGFHPLCLLIQLAGFFCTFLMLTLLFTDVDAFGCYVYLAMIILQLGTIIAHGVLRKIYSRQPQGSNEYQSVPLQTL